MTQYRINQIGMNRTQANRRTDENCLASLLAPASLRYRAAPEEGHLARIWHVHAHLYGSFSVESGFELGALRPDIAVLHQAAPAQISMYEIRTPSKVFSLF
ncbi:hypothetical protein AVEN_65415-1 [Araneus ventricosus]|uniref:Uncharacterized protein n=1 Tax=Araneus ventricosus TaxID=182803 RepID=A0A4Y2JAW1_ARAVE|nr:hypothetical protein AVEN_65415-1 [Araneus ventricosus]